MPSLPDSNYNFFFLLTPFSLYPFMCSDPFFHAITPILARIIAPHLQTLAHISSQPHLERIQSITKTGYTVSLVSLVLAFSILRFNKYVTLVT